MAQALDEEIRREEEETRQEIAYIREQMPDDVNAAFDDELMAWTLDAIALYYCESGILDADGTDEVSIDMDDVALYVVALAEEEGRKALDKRDVALIAEADIDYQEQQL